jgi:hypothetical protein
MGGVLVHSHTTNSHTPTGGSLTTDASTDYNNTYIMRDSAQISSSTYVSDSTQTIHHDGYWETWTNSYSSTWHDPWDEVIGSTTAWVTNYAYDTQGHLKQVAINDGQPRTVTYVTNMMGEVMKRDVVFNSGSTTAPHEMHYYLAGMAIGDITNNGTSATDYVTQIAARTAVNSGSGFNPTVGYTTPNGYGPFAGGANTGSPYADFDQSYDPINGYDSGATAINYVIKQGDTLQSLARQIWGDANLWYLIAQANGLNANSVLQVGSSIVIPNNQIHNFHNNSSTFRVYNPNLAIGDVSPTAPEIPAPPPPPPPPPTRRGGGCGLIGKIFIAVVAIAVAAVTYGVLSGPASSFAASSLGFSGALAGGGVAAGSSAAIAGGVLAGAAGGIAGAVVGQGLEVATGLQNSFDWGAVALGAMGGALGGGFAGAGAFGSLGEIGGAVARGVTGSIVTQGIGVATGLQSHFDWAGVAAAGVGAGVGAFAYQQIQVQGGFGFSDQAFEMGAESMVSGLARDIANAATRTLVNGSDFGDNIIAALPDTIGQTIGNMVAGAATGRGQRLVQAPNIQAPALNLSDNPVPYINDDGSISSVTPYAASGAPYGESATAASGVESVVISADAWSEDEKLRFDLTQQGWWRPSNLYADEIDRVANAGISPMLLGAYTASSAIDAGLNAAAQWAARPSGLQTLKLFDHVNYVGDPFFDTMQDVDAFKAYPDASQYRSISNGELAGTAIDAVTTVAPFAKGLGTVSKLAEPLAARGFSSVARGGRVVGAAEGIAPRIHKNSLSYVGDTHVYVIRRADGSLYKVGESAQGVRVGDGASIRAEQQARALRKETGENYRTEIRQNFGGKADARAYETRFIQTYERLFGQRPLGNPLDR